MSWFEKREKGQEKPEEKLPSSETTALQVILDDVKRLIDEFFSDVARRGDAEQRNDLEQSIMRGVVSNRAYAISILRALPQSTFSIINRKTLSNSLLMAMVSAVSVLQARTQTITSEMEMRIHRISTGGLSKVEFEEHMRRLHELLPELIAIPYSVPMILKDFDGIVNLNTPFNITSDLVRKHTGYTATS